jgi:acyl-coenzyme A thioesterase PaaI-like protein
MKIRYLKPVPVNKGSLNLRAKLVGMRRNLADVHVELFCPGKKLCAVADVTYYTFPQKVAAEKLHFPAHEKFFEDNNG